MKIYRKVFPVLLMLLAVQLINGCTPHGPVLPSLTPDLAIPVPVGVTGTPARSSVTNLPTLAITLTPDLPRDPTQAPNEGRAAQTAPPGAGPIVHLPFTWSGENPLLLIGASDVSDCDFSFSEKTARLLDLYPSATVFTAGDNVHHDGLPEDFANCFEPYWGRHKDRIRPAVGNHEYVTHGAAAYAEYFGAAAGVPGQFYYSYDLGNWHILVINSNLTYQPGRPMTEWLRADLAGNQAQCTLAYWHHPRYSSGAAGGFDRLTLLWDDLYAAGVEFVVSGHDHLYERFAPQDAYGRADLQRGVRQFVVGTGGSGSTDLGERQPNSELVLTEVNGVIKFQLYEGRYAWEFLSAEGGEVLDSGSDTCH